MLGAQPERFPGPGVYPEVSFAGYVFECSREVIQGFHLVLTWTGGGVHMHACVVRGIDRGSFSI